MIPKQIFTAWLGDKPPELIERCIKTQKISGYEHALITLDDRPTGIPYVEAAIAAKQWVKAVDYLRMYYLYNYGGIFLDADVEIMDGKNFDDLLSFQMFAARENNGFIGLAILGARPYYPFIRLWMNDVEENFKGDDGLYFQSSMDVMTRGYFEKDWGKDGFALVPVEYLYPFDHQTGKVHATSDTITYHHFLKSWV